VKNGNLGPLERPHVPEELHDVLLGDGGLQVRDHHLCSLE
jgi:hypothetical protein